MNMAQRLARPEILALPPTDTAAAAGGAPIGRSIKLDANENRSPAKEGALLKIFSAINALELSVQEDLSANRGPITALSSHTLEGIGNLGLSLIEVASDLDKTHLQALSPLIARLGA